MENTNIIVGNFVTGSETNGSPKTGKALSYVESVNDDGSLNLKVIASIYGAEHSNGIHEDGYFVNRDASAYVKTTVHDYVTENRSNGERIYFQEWFEKYAIKEKYDDIKENALVIAMSGSGYSVTNDRTLCYVTLDRGNEINVLVLTQTEVSMSYPVEKRKFRTISIEEYFTKFPNATKNSYYKEKVLGGYYNVAPDVNGNNGVMDLKNRTYEVSDEITELHTEGLMKAFGMFKYGVDHDGCKTKVENCNQAKAGIRNILSKLPEWDEEKCYARFSINWERPIVPERITAFTNWFATELKDIYIEKGCKIAGMDYEELSNSLDRVRATLRLMTDLLKVNNTSITAYQAVTFNGFNINYFKEELNRLKQLKEYFYSDNYVYRRGKYTYLSKEDGELYFNILHVLENLKDWVLMDGHKMTKERAKYINELFQNCHKTNGKALIRVSEGMKMSRFIGQLGKLTNVDKVVNMQKETWWEDGNYHESEHDEGWNGQFAKFADGINPFTIPRHTIISTNPVDYTLSSYGKNWTSCHHLCKEELDMSGSYRGMYSGGNDGYMTDSATVVMYMINEEYDGKDFEFQPKERRCLFHIGEDKLIQGRVYPDGRDGGELGASRQMRAIMQTALAKALNVPNLWKVEEGTSAIYPYCVTEGRNYPDYTEYKVCTISFLKGNNSEYIINPVAIRIGSKATCPICGDRHMEKGWVYCYSHQHHYNDKNRDNSMYMADRIEGSEENANYCAECGCIVDEDDHIYDPDTGNYYCDENCAYEHDCYWCENVGEYHSEHVYYDNYRCEHFYSRYDDYIETVDGNTYTDEDNARRDGYRCTHDDEWYPEDEVYYCAHCEEWYHESEYDFENDMCVTCAENLVDDEIEED